MSLEPGQEVVIKVAESVRTQNELYTAMVDEGLLDITQVSPPDAWPRFYAREALGYAPGISMMRSWVFGGKERLLPSAGICW